MIGEDVIVATINEFDKRIVKGIVTMMGTIIADTLDKASVTSYLPYKKGVYFPSTEKERISVGAERQRR